MGENVANFWGPAPMTKCLRDPRAGSLVLSLYLPSSTRPRMHAARHLDQNEKVGSLQLEEVGPDSFQQSGNYFI